MGDYVEDIVDTLNHLDSHRIRDAINSLFDVGFHRPNKKLPARERILQPTRNKTIDVLRAVRYDVMGDGVTYVTMHTDSPHIFSHWCKQLVSDFNTSDKVRKISYDVEAAAYSSN